MARGTCRRCLSDRREMTSVIRSAFAEQVFGMAGEIHRVMEHAGDFDTVILHAIQDGMSGWTPSLRWQPEPDERSCGLPAIAEVIHEGVTIHFDGIAAIQLVKAQRSLLA